MPKINKVEITPTTLAKVGQAIDYRFKIRENHTPGYGLQDEDGADLVGTLQDLYRWLSQRMLEAAYGEDAEEFWAGNTHRMTEDELAEALTTLEQFDMLQLLLKDESHLDATEGN